MIAILKLKLRDPDGWERTLSLRVKELAIYEDGRLCYRDLEDRPCIQLLKDSDSFSLEVTA